MKHFKLSRLNTKGFAHWIIPVVALVIIGGIGSYVMLHKSHADIDGASVCSSGAPGVRYAFRWTERKTAYGVLNRYEATNLNSNTTQSKKYVCWLLISTGAAYGVSKPMSVAVKQNNSAYVSDTGNFKYYAGPVYAGNYYMGSTYTKGYLTYRGVTYKFGVGWCTSSSTEPACNP